ncbi:MAG: hypothetical protein KDE14_10780 [Rhodobacteraceae bacterium]|nr:hypothetical protein [Paracoccaceae bacterium]
MNLLLGKAARTASANSRARPNHGLNQIDESVGTGVTVGALPAFRPGPAEIQTESQLEHGLGRSAGHFIRAMTGYCFEIMRKNNIIFW